MLEAVSTSETSAIVYQTTWPNIPEDSHINFKTAYTLTIWMHFADPQGARAPLVKNLFIRHFIITYAVE
jgi:hypothetical protein